MPVEPQCHISTVGEQEIEGKTEDPDQPCPWDEVPEGHPRDWADFLRRYCAQCHQS